MNQASLTQKTPQSPDRMHAWCLFLGAPITPFDILQKHYSRGASPAYDMIKNDTFRTLATDPLFQRRVTINSLSRLLNAVAWQLDDDNKASTPQGSASPTRDASPNHTVSANLPSKRAIYVQGINVLAAPLLYACASEAEAYTTLHTLLTWHIPSYTRGAMDGVHRGLVLVDKFLALLDPKLSAHLSSKNLSASIYAFPSVLTLSACTPPLPEVLVLWDFLFAWGTHCNVLAVVAQLVLIREDLLAEESPGKLLRTFPPLGARRVVELVMAFLARTPEGLYRELVEHTRE
jgi:cell cycle arrest protein BUB2